ncbi:MAG: energy transducer TonB [Candidatus Korobacteraceae bacterium]|jgi:TonB family protein
MANDVLNAPILNTGRLDLLPRGSFDQSLWESLFSNIRETFFPEKLPPLQLTSRPVKVRDIWGAYNYKKQGAWVSLVVHALAVGGLIALTILGAKAVKQEVHETVTLIAPPVSDYLPPISMKKNDVIGGGGGGGDHDKIPAVKGKLPKPAMEQITPPAMVVRNDHPKLAVEPTVVMPPQVKLPTMNAMNFGDPKAVLPSGPASNGTGSGGGIGSGSGGGVGVGTGPGVGQGRGGGIGGGVFRVGNGVSAPRALDAPDPEYSEEARKAKYQGTVVLWMVVDPNGAPQQVRVTRKLGMGLDEKAIEAVRKWKFEPAMKDGKPVAVQISVEVNFRLY